MLEAQLPTIITVLAAAGIDSINPCAIGVLILMLSVLLSGKRSPARILWLGGLYIFAIFATYLLAGLGLTYFFTSIPLALTEYIAIGVALLVILAGLLEIKDYFWYGRGVSLTIPLRVSEKLDALASRSATTFGVIFLGVFVAAVELPCTGAPYLAVITILAQYFDFTAFLLLVLYNIIFLIPLIVILLLVVSGKELAKIHSWKQANRPFMRLAVGILLVAMGWLLILISNGTINLG